MNDQQKQEIASKIDELKSLFVINDQNSENNRKWSGKRSLSNAERDAVLFSDKLCLTVIPSKLHANSCLP